MFLNKHPTIEESSGCEWRNKRD